jgi:Bacterial Ig-like domain
MVRRRLIASIAAIAALAALGGCTNPNSFMSAVKDEAKSALGMFLVVSSISPSNAATEVNPNTLIQINFDRSLDTDTAVASNILIAPSSSPTAYVSWTYAYDAALKRLSITPAALNGGSTYIVTIKKSIASSSGEPLQSDYTWNFSTATLPGGTILINGGAAYANSSTSSIVLNLYPNNLATNVRYNLDSPPSTPFLPVPITMTVSYTPVSSFFTGGDKTYTLYYQFQTNTPGVVSDVYSASIILDTTPPTKPVVTPPGTTSHYPVWSWVSGGNGGNGTFNYCLDGGTWSGETTTTSYSAAAGLANGSHNVQVEERDAAGNWSSITTSTVTLAAPPNPPVVTGPSKTGFNMPTWSWTSGGFGSGNYQYQVDSTSGSWTPLTSTGSSPTWSASFQPSSAFADNTTHTIYVQEADPVMTASWSQIGSMTTTISYSPADGATGVSLAPTFSWPDSARLLIGTTYTLQFDIEGVWTAQTTTASYNSDTGMRSLTYAGTTLAKSTLYAWRIVRSVSGLRLATYIPSSLGATFTTTGLIIIIKP